MLALLVLLGSCGLSESESDEENGRPEGTQISVTEARMEPVEVTERTIGQITSRTAPDLRSEVTGRITGIFVDEGDRVEAGDLLLTIDTEPYELAAATARTDVRRLEARLRTQRRELERNTELLRDGAITQSAFDAIESEVEELEEQLEGARLQQRIAERDLRLTRLEAPVNGAIDERLVSEGDHVGAGDALFRLVGRELRARLPFPETLADGLEVGQSVRLRRPGSTDGVLDGTISELRPAFIEGSRTLEAIVNLDDALGWRPGGSVAATVVMEDRANVVVPARAVVQRPAGEVVYVLENGSVSARTVEVGWRGSERIELRSGVEPGERIAVDGAGFLSDGAAVRIEAN